MNPTKTVKRLNSLLRGELAATETYQQALQKVGHDQAEGDLRVIQCEHRDAANELRLHVHHFGGKPDQGSGAWGAFAKGVTGIAKMFGRTPAFKALKEGEEEGMSSYQDALQDPELPAECRTLITSTLLPRCRTHVKVLDRLMNESDE